MIYIYIYIYTHIHTYLFLYLSIYCFIYLLIYDNIINILNIVFVYVILYMCAILFARGDPGHERRRRTSYQKSLGLDVFGSVQGSLRRVRTLRIRRPKIILLKSRFLGKKNPGMFAASPGAKRPHIKNLRV